MLRFDFLHDEDLSEHSLFPLGCVELGLLNYFDRVDCFVVDIVSEVDLPVGACPDALDQFENSLLPFV